MHMRNATDSTPSLDALIEASPSQESEDSGFFRVSKITSIPAVVPELTGRESSDDVFFEAMAQAAARASRKPAPAEWRGLETEGVDDDDLLETGCELSAGLGLPVLRPKTQRSRAREILWIGSGFGVALLVLVGFAVSASRSFVPENGQEPTLTLATATLEPQITEEVVELASIEPLASPSPAHEVENTLSEPESDTDSVVRLETTLIEGAVEEDINESESSEAVEAEAIASSEPAVEPTTEEAAPAMSPTTEPTPETAQAVMVVRLLESQNAPTVESDGPALPSSLSRPQVVAGMRSATTRARNCTDDSQDRVIVNVTIDGTTGQVSRATVAGPLNGTASGNCVERAVRRAQFPRFSDETLNIRSYPLQLRTHSNR